MGLNGIAWDDPGFQMQKLSIGKSKGCFFED